MYMYLSTNLASVNCNVYCKCVPLMGTSYIGYIYANPIGLHKSG